MANLKFRESISEVLDIINHMDEKYLEKLPLKFVEFLEKNQLENYVSKIDHSKSLNENILQEQTRELLGIIYLNYWCDSEDKKYIMIY